MNKSLSWRDVFDSNKLFDYYPLLEDTKQECAEVARNVRYQFMVFNDKVYFIGHDNIEEFCLVSEIV